MGDKVWALLHVAIKRELYTWVTRFEFSIHFAFILPKSPVMVVMADIFYILMMIKMRKLAVPRLE